MSKQLPLLIALAAILSACRGLGLATRAPEAEPPPRPRVVAALISSRLDTGAVVVIDRVTLRTVVTMDERAIAELEALLAGRAVVVDSLPSGACRRAPARACVRFTVLSYADGNRVATVRAYWGATLPGGRCGGDYEATFRVRWERRTARVVQVSDEDFGDCGIEGVRR